MDSREGKEQKEGKAADEGGGNPLLRDLALFATSEDFNAALEAFYCKHAHSAVDYEEGGEHALEWTDLHRAYMELLEFLLEGFCSNVVDMSAADVFAVLEDCAESDPSWPFVPEFLGNTEYEAFVRHLHNHAVEARAEREATSGAHIAEGCSPEMAALERVKGVYMVVEEDIDWGQCRCRAAEARVCGRKHQMLLRDSRPLPPSNAGQFKVFLLAQGVPKMFLRIFIYTAKNSKHIFGTTPDGVSLAQKFLFFGAQSWSIALDQETTLTVPVIGKVTVLVTVDVDDRGLPRIQQTRRFHHCRTHR